MAISVCSLLNPRLWRFQWRYLRKQTPWDTQVTPPEVMAFLKEVPPGKALDLGCGTGTNAITLARHGWRVTGVDFVPSAIVQARKKAVAAGMDILFHQASVTDLSMLTGQFDYALDIGCLFGLKPEERLKYATNLSRLVASQGWYMLYAWLPRMREGKSMGVSAQQVDDLLGIAFTRVHMVIGEEGGAASAWYWYRRKGQSADG